MTPFLRCTVDISPSDLFSPFADTVNKATGGTNFHALFNKELRFFVLVYLRLKTIRQRYIASLFNVVIKFPRHDS